jgi:peptidoglycan/LPS O-acetylase OafA/YrhL
MKNDAHVIKIQEFDILRALAIIMLMFHHSEAYGLTFLDIPLEGLTPYFEAILLGIFFFISGYFAGRSFLKENKGSVSFFFSRMLRIFPPYLLAVLLYVYVLDITLKKWDLIVYLTGTHFIFAPNYAKPVVTLWYVGAMILFYFIFGLLLANLHYTRGLIIGATLVFAATYALHHWTGLIDERFYKYFIVFLAGILFVRLAYLSNWLSGGQVLLKFIFALSGLFVFSQVLAFSSVSPLYIFGTVFFIISWVILLFALATKIKSQIILKLAGLISYASFFAYLIHRPLWAWLVGVFSVDVGRDQVFFKMIPASIVVFILSYYLQSGYDRLLTVFRERIIALKI